MSKKNWLVAVILMFVVIVAVIEWKSEKNYEIKADGIEHINVVESADTVKVTVSDDDMIHISYYEGASYKYEITEENGVLKITGDNRRAINIDIQDSPLIIKVPKDYGKYMEINTEKNASVNEAINFESISINEDEDY